eukprot:1460062-Prymnesium_polylepis.1
MSRTPLLAESANAQAAVPREPPHDERTHLVPLVADEAHDRAAPGMSEVGESEVVPLAAPRELPFIIIVEKGPGNFVERRHPSEQEARTASRKYNSSWVLWKCWAPMKRFDD